MSEIIFGKLKRLAVLPRQRGKTASKKSINAKHRKTAQQRKTSQNIANQCKSVIV
jgi:hypothetical protein